MQKRLLTRTPICNSVRSRKSENMTHILIIDDDAELSGMLTEYLAGEGFESTTVNKGGDGIAAAMTDRFQAVILDVMMPGISGIDVLHEIRRKSAVPIIMLTAKGSDVDRVVGLEMGADDYVAKPYYPRELVARLRAVLRRRTPGHRQRASTSHRSMAWNSAERGAKRPGRVRPSNSPPPSSTCWAACWRRVTP